MSVTHANGNVTEARKDFSDTLGDLTTQTKERAADLATQTKERAADLATQTKDVARRRPVALVTAAAAGVAIVVATVVTVVLRRKAKQTPRQKAVNAWRRTSKSVRKRVRQ